METAELKEALEHDQAIKAAQAAKPQSEPEHQQAVPVSVVINEMENKQALLAKSVALGLVDVARQFTEQALHTGRQRIIVDKKTREQQVETDAPKPGTAEACLKVVQLALDLARTADALGDRPIARSAKSENTKAS